MISDQESINIRLDRMKTKKDDRDLQAKSQKEIRAKIDKKL